MNDPFNETNTARPIPEGAAVDEAIWEAEVQDAEPSLLSEGPKQPAEKSKKHWTNREEVMGWTFTGIPLLGFLIFGLIPLAFSIYTSLYQFDGLAIFPDHSDEFEIMWYDPTFVGLKNFGTVLKDSDFWMSVLNTLFCVATMLVSLAVSIFISMMLYHCKRGKKLYQTVFFIPYVCSMVAITFMWQWIFDWEHGILNSLIGKQINWINGSPHLFRLVMFVVMLWSGTGFNIILLSAAMTNINKNTYEAADIDGAGMFTKFFKITLPAISPTVFYLLITGIIGSLQEFTRFQVMAPSDTPAVGGANVTIVYYLYRNMYSKSDIGVATAVGWILALLIGLVTFANFKISKKWVSYDE